MDVKSTLLHDDLVKDIYAHNRLKGLWKKAKRRWYVSSKGVWMGWNKHQENGIMILKHLCNLFIKVK